MLSLRQEPLVVVLPENHRLTHQSTISLADLVEEEFVLPLYQVVDGLPEQIYQICSQAGFVPKVTQEAIFMVTILGLVSAEIGISILPSSVQNLHRQGVVYRPIQEQTLATQLTVAWRRDNSSPILQQFLKIALLYATSSNSNN